MLRIVTDGAVDLPAEWYQQYDIQRIPINVHFGEEKTYIQDVELKMDEFYKLVDSKSLPHPKTSQPSPHLFVEFYKTVAQPGDTILSIHITSKLSGTYASSVAAAEELKGTYNVVPVDTLCGSMGTAFMCRSARRKILHDHVRYEERGPAVTKKRAHARAAKMIRELRSLGYRVELALAPSETPA